MRTTRIVIGIILPALFGQLALSADTDKGTAETLTSRSLEEIKKTLTAINAPPDKSLDAAARERALALKRLQSYRYLAGLPYDDVELDDELNRYAQAAAKVCQKLGRLDHNPPNPGLPEEEYKMALKGAQKSNLARGAKTNSGLATSIDLWMDDSDATNVDRLGHRRWNLNPSMRKVGFGRAGLFTATYAHDRSRETVPDYDFVSWPARGLMPAEYFRPDHAWSVTLNPLKYKPPGDAVAAKIYAADKAGKRSGAALTLNYKNVDVKGFGVPNCIIFRPARLDLTSGRRYLVEIEGLQTDAGEAATVTYVVQFCRVGAKK